MLENFSELQDVSQILQNSKTLHDLVKTEQFDAWFFYFKEALKNLR